MPIYLLLLTPPVGTPYPAPPVAVVLDEDERGTLTNPAELLLPITRPGRVIALEVHIGAHHRWLIPTSPAQALALGDTVRIPARAINLPPIDGPGSHGGSHPAHRERTATLDTPPQETAGYADVGERRVGQ